VLLSQLLLAQLVSPVTHQELPMLLMVSHSVHEASALLNLIMVIMATPLLTVVLDTALLDIQVLPHLSSKTAHGVLASKM
jgi:ABC-type nitrate/sulfonate/bicarbonate transport system ATPase subunit